MNLTNTAVTDGVQIFVFIVITLIALSVALSSIDMRKEKQKKD